MNYFNHIKHYTKTGIIMLVSLFLLAFTIQDFDKIKTYFTESYKIKSPHLPNGLNFANEIVPINQQDIRERMDRELMSTTFWQSNTMMLMKKSKKYFPVIEPILKANGIPDDFKYLCVQESGLSNVSSPAGAKGFWQLMEGTATPYGVEINEFVDERYDLEKSTQIACTYFKEAFAIYNNWTLTAASYNRGMNGITRDLKNQKVCTFYDLHLNEETSRYIFRILAYKLIFENPDLYGYFLKSEDYYKPFKTKKLEIDSTIEDLSEFAVQNGSNYKMIKTLNPWLRDKSLPNKRRKNYSIQLPAE